MKIELNPCVIVNQHNFMGDKDFCKSGEEYLNV